MLALSSSDTRPSTTSTVTTDYSPALVREGTRNLLEAARAANASGFLAQSIAWRSGPGSGSVVDAHEDAVVSAGGTVLRYGLFYGPSTFYENAPPPHPRMHIDAAARRTMPFLTGPSGIFTITDDEAAP